MCPSATPDSTDTESDELTDVEAKPLEATEEDHPLMLALSITVLQSVEG